jgi:simple sugar transport system permease protein
MTADIFMSFVTSMVRSATPLVIWALAVTLAERAGVWMLSVEGIGLAGALAGVMGEIYLGAPALGLLSSLITGAALGAVNAVLLVRLPTDQTAIGIAFNTTMIGLSSFVFRMGGSKAAGFVSGLAGSFFGFTAHSAMALCLVFLMWLFLFKTGAGLRLRSLGDGVHAAEASGINVAKARMAAITAAGVLAGLAGDALTQGWIRTFSDNVTMGRGFIGMAAVYFGRWNPMLAALACLIFGAGEALAFRAQAGSFGGNNSFYFLMIPYAMTLAAVAILGQAKGPADAGKPLRKH